MRVPKLCTILVVTATLLTAQAPPSVVESGPQAAITTADRQDIARLLEAGQKDSMALDDKPRPGRGTWVLRAFSDPDPERANLRRGGTTTIQEQLSPADMQMRNVAGPKSWATRGTFSYTQVVVPKRMFQDIRGPNDPKLPFANSTTLTDDELVSLVTFIRSSPDGPPVDFRNWTPERVSKFGAMVRRVGGDLAIDA